jgi:hypothetical protein
LEAYRGLLDFRSTTIHELIFVIKRLVIG